MKSYPIIKSSISHILIVSDVLCQLRMIEHLFIAPSIDSYCDKNFITVSVEKMVFLKMSPKMVYVLLLLFILSTMLYFYNPAVESGREMSWQNVQSKRKEMVAQVCRKYKKIKLQPIDYSRFHYSSDYDLMFCTSPKTGSTSYFMTTFAQIMDGE